jgi:hypothetical protein
VKTSTLKLTDLEILRSLMSCRVFCRRATAQLLSIAVLLVCCGAATARVIMQRDAVIADEYLHKFSARARGALQEAAT